MPDVQTNKEIWRLYDWAHQGEEWSINWGNSFTQWLATILPRIGYYFPSETVLEIAPGYGRWTRFLIQGSNIYRGIDLSENCIDFCRNKFSNKKNAHFFLNDGKSLEAVSDKKYNFVFSCDSLVHVEMKVLDAYIEQIIQLLTLDGVAFIHHSNLGIYKNEIVRNLHGRNTSVTADAVERSVRNFGGKMITQEILTWGEDYILNDCFSLFGRKEGLEMLETKKLVSKNFMENEVWWAKNIIHNYGRKNDNV